MDAVPAIVTEIDATAERRTTPCGGGRLNWRLWGAGPPLVLLHGDFGSWTHWLRNISALARHFRLLVPDMPGYGESDAPPTPWSPFSLGELLAEGAAEILGPTVRYDVAGFSFGGIIAGHLAAVAPESVRNLVLLGAGGLGLPGSG
ncbi:MAG: alpha/beta fold hydrolase, partial [Acetobacteraceae bacterium]